MRRIKKIFIPRVLLLICVAMLITACDSIATASTLFPDTSLRETLLKAMTAKLNAKSYRMKFVHFGAQGMSGVIEAEYLAPNSYHFIAESSGMRSSSGKQELITLGNEGYRKLADGTWQKTESDSQSLDLFRLRDQMLIETLTKAKDEDVEFVGQEELNGSMMLVFQHSFSGTPSVSARGRTKIWVGVKDGFPYKIESEAEATYQGKAMSAKTTITYSDYNADIKITQPR